MSTFYIFLPNFFSPLLGPDISWFLRAFGLLEPRLDVETSLSESLDLWYLFVRKDEMLSWKLQVFVFFLAEKLETFVFLVER